MLTFWGCDASRWPPTVRHHTLWDRLRGRYRPVRRFVVRSTEYEDTGVVVQEPTDAAPSAHGARTVAPNWQFSGHGCGEDLTIVGVLDGQPVFR